MTAPVWQSAQFNSNGSNVTTISVNKPASVAVGDLLVICIGWSNNPTSITSPPTGFTLWDSHVNFDNHCNYAVYYRIADGSEASSFSVSWTTGRRPLITCHRITGTDTTTPIATGTSGTSSEVVGTSQVLSSITGLTASTDYLIFAFITIAQEQAISGPGSMTERIDTTTGGSGVPGTSQGVYTEAFTGATSTGTRTITWTPESVNDSWSMFAIQEPITGPWTLDVTVTGSGTVTSSPAGVDCPGDCDESYSDGTEVTLTAVADAGWHFSHWSGDGSGSGLTREVTMDANKTVVAVFSQDVTPVVHRATTFLGCGEWVARILTRGGGSLLLEAAPTSLRCGRVLDGMSNGEATFAISDIPDYCYGVLADLKPWAYELELLRDGASAWVGPIADQLHFTRNDVTIRARDLFAWMERRVLPVDRNQSSDLSVIFAEYVTDALSRDPSPNISIDAQAAGIVEQRTVRAADFRIAADALRELGDDGVDFTMVGRTVRVRAVGGGEFAGTLLDAHTDVDTAADLDGLLAASELIVQGSTSGDSDIPVYGIAGGIDPLIGLVQIVQQESQIVTAAGATSAAEVQLEAAGVTPLHIPCTLNAEAPFAFADLVPGNFLDVRLRIGVFEITEVMMLESVSVTVAPSESIAIALTRRVD